MALFMDRIQLSQGYRATTQEFQVLIWLTTEGWKAESQPWSHLVVLSSGAPDWE